MNSKATKFCTNCGNKIPASVKFCPYCGHPQASANTTGATASNGDSNFNISASFQKTDSNDTNGDYQSNYDDTQPNTDESSYQESQYNQPNSQPQQNTYNQNNNGFTPAEQRYIRVFVKNHEKHMLPAYLLMLVFVCGTHFYLHQNAAGVIFILIQLCDFFVIGFFIDLVWIILDLILIPVWVHDRKARAKKQAISFVMMQRQNE